MIFNLTPHPINVVTAEGEPIATFVQQATPARLTTSTKTVGYLDAVLVTETIFGDTEGLPAVQFDTYYIVSRMVMAANPTRGDLLVPNQLVRDDSGRIIGCQSLSRN